MTIYKLTMKNNFQKETTYHTTENGARYYAKKRIINDNYANEYIMMSMEVMDNYD